MVQSDSGGAVLWQRKKKRWQPFKWILMETCRRRRGKERGNNNKIKPDRSVSIMKTFLLKVCVAKHCEVHYLLIMCTDVWVRHVSIAALWINMSGHIKWTVTAWRPRGQTCGFNLWPFPPVLTILAFHLFLKGGVEALRWVVIWITKM